LGQTTGTAATVTHIPLDGAIAPASFSIADSGQIFVSDGGVLHVYDTSGRQVTSVFNGLPGGRLVDLLRSFNNFDPLTMNTPGYRNVLPSDAGK
jgi:hypothetical protein